jgi:hypothetical protein
MSSARRQGEDQRDLEVEFRRVMSYVTERAIVDGLREEVMAALFDVLNPDGDNGERGGRA